MVPQAIGTLESTPFGELLVQALDHRLTGTLVLEETGGARHGIYLEAGTPRKAKVGTSVAHLGDVLVDTGAISSEVHEETLSRALRERVLYGQLLLGEGRISEHALGVGLREQLYRQIIWLFRQPLDTHYGYFEGTNLLSRWGGTERLEPSTLELIWRGLCEHAPLEAMEAALLRVGARRIALQADLPADHFAFMGDDRRIVAMLGAGPRRLSELIAAEPWLETDIRRVLYFLLLTRSADLGVPSGRPVGIGEGAFVAPTPARLPFVESEPPAPTPRRDSPPSIPHAVVHGASLREELRRRTEMPNRTHYEVLGLSPDATASQVQAAFFLLSKRWHPDRLGPELFELRDAAASVFESISQAHQVLADPGARAAYDEDLANGEGIATTPLIERALSAELAFQKAESFLARGNITAAVREAMIALEHDPTRAEHIALHAWLSALKPGADERPIGLAFARALKASQTSVKVHWYRGLFLKRTGRHAAALQEFRFVCERDRRHIDAAREVRIYEQRLQNSPKDHPSLAPEAPLSERSTWSRLFKRRG